MPEDKRPVVKQRVSLNIGGLDDSEDVPEAWEPNQGVTDVTVLARDLHESIWTVWDHTAKCIKMINFDENGNWLWVEPTEEIIDDQN